MRAVQTKNPVTACAVGVMRNVGWSWLSKGALRSQEMLGPPGAGVVCEPGASANGEPAPSLSERGTSRLHSLCICGLKKVNQFNY